MTRGSTACGVERACVRAVDKLLCSGDRKRLLPLFESDDPMLGHATTSGQPQLANIINRTTTATNASSRPALIAQRSFANSTARRIPPPVLQPCLKPTLRIMPRKQLDICTSSNNTVHCSAPVDAVEPTGAYQSHVYSHSHLSHSGHLSHVYSHHDVAPPRQAAKGGNIELLSAVGARPLLRIAGLMRTGTNFGQELITLNLVGAAFLSPGPCVKATGGRPNLWHWKHAVWGANESRYEGDTRMWKDSQLSCTAGAGRHQDCGTLRWPRVTSGAEMLRLFDKLLEYVPLHIILTRNPFSFASSLHKAMLTWKPNCLKAVWLDVHPEMKEYCLHTISSFEMGRKHARAWNEHHSWWLTMWEAVPRRIVWLSYECALVDANASVDLLSSMLQLPRVKHTVHGRQAPVMPGDTGPWGHSNTGSFAALQASLDTHDYMTKLPAGWEQVIGEEIDYGVAARLARGVYRGALPPTTTESLVRFPSKLSCESYLHGL